MNEFEQNTDRGVEYNIKITKRKQKDNIIEMDSSSLSSSEVVTSGEILSSSFCEEGHLGEAEPQEISGAIAHSTPHDMIKETDVRRAFFQLYKNEERYKLKVRLNLIMNGQEHTVDFIAPLTTDRRNFKKYTPLECGDWFVEWSDMNCKDIKEQVGVKAYRGKFHLAQGYKSGRKVITQVEPWSQCVVWFNPASKSWWYIVNCYAFDQIGEMTEEGLTIQQKKANLHRQNIWTNPEHDTRVRPQTWAQRMVGAK